MKLINKDALIQKVKKEEEERHLDKDTASTLQFLIDEYAEPVDAIPTEWIRSWAARTIKFTDIYKKMFFKDAISYLLMDWEAAQRGAKSANDEWVEMLETVVEAEHKRDGETENESNGRNNISKRKNG